MAQTEKLDRNACRLSPGYLLCTVICLTFLAFLGNPLASRGQSTVATNPSLSPEDRTILTKHVPSYASHAVDQGTVPADTIIPNVEILFALSPEQEASLQQLLREQQDRNSPNYHKWLTPDAFGLEFGASPDAIERMSAWLHQYGLGGTASRSKRYMTVVGDVGQLAAAFSTEFHYFEMNGSVAYSVSRDPSIPNSLAPFVHSISGLSEHLERAGTGSALQPRGTSTSGKHYIAPADFATIYDINAVYKAGYTGTGQSIAIVGRSRVDDADIQNFGAFTNLSLKNPLVALPPGSVDPGETNDGDQDEATLDVTRASSVAQNATVTLVINAKSNGGVGLPMRYVIDNQVSSIMSASFYGCELNNGGPNTYFYDSLFTQGAAEGITTFVSSGDGGVDSCETPDSVPEASQVASINYLCASPNVTCVGGTTFNDTTTPGSYWSATNAAGFSSALGYIPEGAFNEPIDSSTGATQIFAGGGGVSTYVTKPGWQAGVNVPSDGYRDVPDIAFSSSGHDGYVICLAYLGYPCVPNTQGLIELLPIAGTSAATPSMAGIQALLDQEEGSALGNINPALYGLANNPSNSVFHDITVASSGVTACSVATPSLCNNSTPSASSLQGGQAGYLVDTGFDLATGWGSIDVLELLKNWSAVSAQAKTSVDLVLSQTLITVGQSITLSATTSGTGPAPTGTIQFLLNGQPVGDPVPLVSDSASVTTTPFGTTQVNTATAVYSGDANYAPATSNAMQFVVTTISSPGFTISSTPMSIAAPGKIGLSSIRITPSNGFTGPVSLTCLSITGVTIGTCTFTPAMVTIGPGPAISQLTLSSVSPSFRTVSSTILNNPPPFDRSQRPLPKLPFLAFLLCALLPTKRRSRGLVGAVFLILFGFYLTACSHPVPTVTVSSAANPGLTQEPITLLASVAAPSGTSSPTGNVQFLINGVTTGSPQALTNGAATLSQTFTTAGTFAITAQYFGNSSYGFAQSTSLSQLISYKNPGTLPGTYSLVIQGTSGTLTQSTVVPVQVQ
jgi:subtilase family serine protease